MEQARRTATADTMASTAVGGDNLGKRYYLSFRFVGTLLGTSLSLCSAYAAYLMPVGILSYINADIGPSPNYVWIPIVWATCVAVAYTLVGRLSDIFGRRPFIVGGNFLGLIGAIVAATAKNIPTLIGASVFIGLAAAVQLSFSMVIGELVPVKSRGYWYTLVVVPVMPFAFFGSYIAYSLLEIASWRWCYYLCIILQASAFILLAASYFPPSFSMLHTVKTRRQLMKKIDYLGIALYTSGFALFLIGLSWGGGYYPWKSAAVISTIVIGGVLIVSFFVWEANCKLESPFIPWSFLVQQPRRFLLPIVTGTVGGMFYYGLTIMWPLQVAAVYSHGMTLREQGWLASVLACGSQLGGMVGGVVFKPIGHHRLQLIFACLVMLGFAAGLSQTGPGDRSIAIACALFTGLGIGWVEVLVLLVAQVGKDPIHMGLIVGCIGSFRSMGGAFAQAVYTTILTNKLTTEIPSRVSSAALGAGLPVTSLEDLFEALAVGTPAAFQAVPGLSSSIIAAVGAAEIQAYVQSFRYVYYAALAFGAAGTISAIFIPSNVNEEMTGFVAKKLEGVVADDNSDEVDIEKGDSEAVETVERSADSHVQIEHKS